MGRTAALIAFVSYLKGEVIEGNQNGIGLRHLACVILGKVQFGLGWFSIIATTIRALVACWADTATSLDWILLVTLKFIVF